MHIHVITEDHGETHILTRLVQALHDPVFTFGPTPDPAADLNYFAVYLTWRLYKDFDDTPTAAWFSHLDKRRGEKVSLWENAARSVDLRLTSAPMYDAMLQDYGMTARVTPPLDRDKFALKPPQAPGRVKIGTSGFVYPGNRKGRALWLAARESRPQWQFVSSGSGWDDRTAHYAWDSMQDFYHRLTVYLCTSTIEGIGYGPLEAMSCGVPVVIPQNVGIFDELPDLENLHRYRAGDTESMLAALDLAVQRLDERSYNPRSLRAATARFTTTAWTDSHLRAFERLLYGIEPQPPSGPWSGRAVMVTVAYGKPARDCARRLIQSWRAHMAGIPALLVSDAPLDVEDRWIEHADSDVGARGPKTKLYDLIPDDYEFVLYLDADTEIINDVSFLFDALAAGWDMVATTNPGKYNLAAEMRRPDNQDECDYTFEQIGTDQILQINGGVIAFRRNQRTAQFWRNWHTEWQRWGKRDQTALDRVLYAAPLRVCVLGKEWNCITRYDEIDDLTAIAHYPMMARRWRGRIDGRLDDPESWAAVHPMSFTDGDA